MTKWAILIGVDSYPGLWTFDGCVNDVECVSQLLKERYGFAREHILEMTYSDTHDASNNANFGGAISSITPTYDNIVSAFRFVLDRGQRDDLFYLHFSGMLRTVDSILPRYSQFRIYNDAVLVPAGVGVWEEGSGQDQKYLHDVEISSIAHQLCEKGLELTFFLDCRTPMLTAQPPPRSATSFFTTIELENMSHGKWEVHSPDTWMRDPHPDAAFTMVASYNNMNIGPQRDKATGIGISSIDYEVLDEPRQKRHGFLTSLLQRAVDHIEIGADFLQLAQLMQDIAQQDSIRGVTTSLSGDTSRVFPGDCCTTFSQARLPLTKQLGDYLHIDNREAMKTAAANTARDHASLYHKILNARSHPDPLDKTLGAYIAGGFRHHQPMCPTVFPSYDDQGIFHMLSGDHMSLLIHNGASIPLYVSVIFLDGFLGVKCILLDQNRASTSSLLADTGTPRQSSSETSLSFRLGYSAVPETEENCEEGNSLKTGTLRVLFTSKPVLCSRLQMPRWKEENAERHALPQRQPNVSVNFNTCSLSGSKETTQSTGSREDEARRIHPESAHVYVDEAREPQKLWYTRDMKVAVHRSTESLEKAI